MGRNRAWSEEEKIYLEENWGTKSITTLSKKLNRSRNAIEVQKNRMGLGRFLDNGDYVTYSQLMQALYGLDSASVAYRNPKKGRDFPIRMRRVGKKKDFVWCI